MKQKNVGHEYIIQYWTLSDKDKKEVLRYRTDSRLFISIQLCFVRNNGKFLYNCNELPIEIINYLASQLDLPPTMEVKATERKATLTDQRRSILTYLKFKKFDKKISDEFDQWIEDYARKGELPDTIMPKAQSYFLNRKIIAPGDTVIERTLINVCNRIHQETFEAIFDNLSPDLLKNIDLALKSGGQDQNTYFNQLKAYPPSAKANAIKKFIEKYNKLSEFNLDDVSAQFVDQRFIEHLFRMAKKYNARDIKRFDKYKRYALMICFLIESRKALLDHIVNMHDQFMMEICRTSRNAHEKQHKLLRKRHKKAVDVMISISDYLLIISEADEIDSSSLINEINFQELKQSNSDMKTFKRLEERGFSDILLRKYPNFRKYFSSFIKLPFQVANGSQYLLESIEVIRKLDSGEVKGMPNSVHTHFISKDLIPALTSDNGKINRNAWELGLALEMRDKLRSGDLYIPESKQHISFWNMMIGGLHWKDIKNHVHVELGFPSSNELESSLKSDFNKSISISCKKWDEDNFASIKNGKLKLKKDDKIVPPEEVVKLQKVIESQLPMVRIEQLLMEVDKITGFTKHFKPEQGHKSRPDNFHKTLLAAIISQATNLGIKATSSSVRGVTVDMLRHVINMYIREETLTAASAEIVNHHYLHPLSATQGSGEISSSDAQRFKIRADSLLASHYPRYYGYYEKAIGIYTHVSDQSSVFNTKAVSCMPREALYVLDGLLETIQ
ncbi:Tn3 family transposase [Thiotrichales bacterium 19X7-9]|nr:Tn3 family transposase [Thiotrichales bacterium 19X7-9]